MESIYAALLLHKAGGKINETNVEKVLTAAGAKVDKDQIVKLIAGLKSTKIEDIIKSASSVPIAAAPTEAPVEKKEKKKKEEEEEEEEEPTGRTKAEDLLSQNRLSLLRGLQIAINVWQ